MDDSYSKEFHSSGNNFGEEHLKKRNSSACKSSEEIRKAVEVCLLSSSCTLDVSGKNIKHLTEEIYRLPKIKYFHLERNVISTIPEDLFQKLPHLVWLDLRYNNIQALPPGIGYHRKTICHIDNFITVAIENSAFRKESYKRATHRTW
uniref:Uncharacterized protein n=1 Tax=Falco tinnunculus TaxID=100819 RepID=A0A8C4UFT8_FALTI